MGLSPVDSGNIDRALDPAKFDGKSPLPISDPGRYRNKGEGCGFPDNQSGKMKMITCESRQKIFAGSSISIIVLLSGCHSPGSHSVENPYYSTVALPGTNAAVEAEAKLTSEPGQEADAVPQPEVIPSPKSVSTDSKAVTVGSPKRSSVSEPPKDKHHPWRFSKDWWDG